jgi:hypothetical protein
VRRQSEGGDGALDFFFCRWSQVRALSNESKAPSPLRSAGALQIKEVPIEQD